MALNGAARIMDIILCGGGEIGCIAAEMLSSAGDSVTMIDVNEERLEYLGNHLDIAVVPGSASSAVTLKAAGAANADAVIATTSVDEVNLVICDIAATLGAHRTMARVDHSMLLGNEELDYASIFSVDRLFSPDRAMASLMASRLRHPGAVAIEQFAGSSIELQQFTVDSRSQGIGVPLHQLRLPASTRIAAVTRDGLSSLPSADTTLTGGDLVTIVAKQDVMADARQLLAHPHYGRTNVAISGGTPAAVWLCQMLGGRDFDVRIFEPDRARSERLSMLLDNATVICADANLSDTFDDEHLDQVDAFVSMRADEKNMLACAYARSRGVELVMPVIRQREFLPLMKQLGLTLTWSPETAAVQAIKRFVHFNDFERMEGLFDGALDVIRLRVDPRSKLVDRTVSTLDLDVPMVILAAENCDGDPIVPGPDMNISPGRSMIIITTPDHTETIRRQFGAGSRR